MRSTNSALSRYGMTVFEVISQLAREADAINLGQGFPEDGIPNDVVARAAQALTEVSNQYAPMLGVPELRRAVAAHDKRFYGLELDWRTQTLVTSGATEALSAAFLALLEPGDEVVVFEPAYDCYIPMIERAGATAKIVRLEPPTWRVPAPALAAAFSNKTKLVVLNSPMNPTGKVFTRAELSELAALVQAHDTYVLCDEVYEHIVFDGAAHVPLMTLPNMFERCIRVGSAGKTFSLTGWKVGYISTSAALLERIARAHQFLTFCTPAHLQHAIAYGLDKNDGYFEALRTAMQNKRDRFVSGLRALGFEVTAPQGTYFACVPITTTGSSDDMEFCKRLIAGAGVAAIPVSAFYANEPRRDYVRFCFAKRDAVLDAALQRLSSAA